jgi:hypothetical protein
MSVQQKSQDANYARRYGPVLWLGFAFWLLGVTLKASFSRTTPVWAEILTLIVEAIGIGFVHQPGKSRLSSSSTNFH